VIRGRFGQPTVELDRENVGGLGSRGACGGGAWGWPAGRSQIVNPGTLMQPPGNA
jgi:hypothetical protein